MESYQDVILDQKTAVATKVAEVQAAAEAYHSKLDEQETALQHIMDLNKKYNSEGDSFLFEVADLSDELNTPIPPLLSALESMWERFTTEVQPRLETITANYSTLEGYSTELSEAGAEDAFARFTLTDLYNKYSEVYGQMTTREEQLSEQLTAERERDALRQEFATTAADLREYAGACVGSGGCVPACIVLVFILALTRRRGVVFVVSGLLRCCITRGQARRWHDS